MADGSPADLVERRPRGELGRGAPPRGAGTLTAILPNGRIVWLHVDEPLATAASAGNLAQEAEHAAHRRAAVARSERRALARLSQTVAADAERLTGSQLDRSRAFRRRIVGGDITLDRKLSKASEDLRSRLDGHLRIQRETVQRLRRRDVWDKIVLATMGPLIAAYGQPGRPFGANNLALTLSALVWLVGDEVVDALFGSEEDSPYPLRDTDAWSYIAPIGNLLTGWWLLDDLQHERFIAGHVPVPRTAFTTTRIPPGAGQQRQLLYRYTARMGLSGHVAPEHFLDFQTFTGVPVVATITSLTWSAAGLKNRARVAGLAAQADGGQLVVTFTALARDRGRYPPPGIVEALEIAWIVDTSKPSPTSSN